MKEQRNGQHSRLEALKEAYANVVVPESVKLRIFHNAFKRRRSRLPVWKPSFALMAAAALVAMALVAVIGRDDPGQDYAARIAALQGDALISQGQDIPALQATDQMQLPLHSSLTTEANAIAEVQIGPHRAELEAKTRLDFIELDKRAVHLRLGSGKVKFSVTPLESKERFIVIVGDLTAEVVGTVFSVSNNAGCQEVVVTEGQVETTRGGEVHLVGAGEARLWCKSGGGKEPFVGSNAEDKRKRLNLKGADDPAPDQYDSAKGADTATESPAKSPHLPTSQTNAEPTIFGEAASSAETATPKNPLNYAEQGGSAEERLYKTALNSRLKGDLEQTLELMGQYMEQYPSGVFAEEALFTLMRINYRKRRMGSVRAHAERFVERYPKSGLKALEAQIMLAESNKILGADPSKVFNALSSVVPDLDKLPVRYQEQAFYLYFTSAEQTGRAKLSRDYAQRYLSRFPHGRYADRAEQILQKK